MNDYSYWARRNTLLAYGINIFQSASASLPIWILFYTRQLGLGVTAAVVLGMTRWATSAVCTIPTGAWADRFGRLRMFRIGQTGAALTFLPFLFTKNYAALLLVQMVGGFMMSMSVGVVEPVIKETYELAKLPDRRYTHFLSNNTVCLYVSRLIAGIVGAWLYSKHPFGPYLSECIVGALALVVSLGMREFKTARSDATSNRQHIGQALSYVWRHQFLRNFFVAMVLVSIATEGIWTGLQPAFVLRQITPASFGLLFGVIALLSAVGAFTSRLLVDKFDGIRLYLYQAMLVLLGTLLFIVPNKWSAIAALVPLGFAFGLIETIGNTNFIRHTSSKYQSTVLSLRSLLYTGFFAIISVLVGRYVDLFGTKTMLLIVTGQTIACVLLLGIIRYTTRIPAIKPASIVPAPKMPGL